MQIDGPAQAQRTYISIVPVSYKYLMTHVLLTDIPCTTASFPKVQPEQI
jgi:hypothetical protein